MVQTIGKGENWYGALAQLGERLHGMQEVSGSIPLGSTSFPESMTVRGTVIRKTPDRKGGNGYSTFALWV